MTEVDTSQTSKAQIDKAQIDKAQIDKAQIDKARAFAALHVPGDPVLIYNVWDAGGAKAIAEAGARAIATGSHAVAGAQGYADGQSIPLDLVIRIAGRIVATVDLPVSVDFEGAYGTTPDAVAASVTQLLGTGAVGMNFEDQVIGGTGLWPVEEQAARIAAARAAADAVGVPFFINARTDLFLKEADKGRHRALLGPALERAQAYRAAGASGYFVPGLTDPEVTRAVVAGAGLPVNVVRGAELPDMAALAALGVARVSVGPGSYRAAMAAMAARFASI